MLKLNVMKVNKGMCYLTCVGPLMCLQMGALGVNLPAAVKLAPVDSLLVLWYVSSQTSSSSLLAVTEGSSSARWGR